jgi:hypothetical protein
LVKKNRRKSFTERSGDELLAMLDHREEYEAFTDSDLDQFVYFAVGVYGMTSRMALIPKLITLYESFLQRVPPAQRRQNYYANREQVLAGDMSVNALLPYLCSDTDIGIVSTAALDFAALHPIKPDDLLAGPKSVLDLFAKGTLSCPAAALGGLVNLGDQRVMELLNDLRRTLATTAVETMTQCRTGYLLAAVIEFYVTWLDELEGGVDDAGFGAVAAVLCDMVCASDPVVRSIQRVFPSTRDHAVELLGTWSLSEYATIVMPRLQAIARREREPRLMPHVLEAWTFS